jgi:hypothetical protein
MTGRSSEKTKLPTIVDDEMEGDESLQVAGQPTCEDQDKVIENVLSKGADIEEEEEIERESK